MYVLLSFRVIHIYIICYINEIGTWSGHDIWLWYYVVKLLDIVYNSKLTEIDSCYVKSTETASTDNLWNVIHNLLMYSFI